uniref:Uncharacterized protein n=1 Tax=Anguilla anguilla TaxID=7936 RepID=A0A0E9XVC3_ANGAN
MCGPSPGFKDKDLFLLLTQIFRFVFF